MAAPGIFLFALGLGSALLPILFSDRLQKAPTGRTPMDPLPPPGGVLPPEADLVPLDERLTSPDEIATALRTVAPSATPKAVAILTAHAAVAGANAPVPNGNAFWLPAHPRTPGPWTLAPVLAQTTSGLFYRLRPLRAFPSLADGVLAGLETLPVPALDAAAHGDVEGYVEALRKAGATAREPRAFTVALQERLAP